MSTFFPRVCPPGSWARAAGSTAMWVDDGVRAGVARPQHERQRLLGALGSVVEKGPQRVKPNPRLNVGAVDSFSLWAPTRVASTSMTSGEEASTSWLGAFV